MNARTLLTRIQTHLNKTRQDDSASELANLAMMTRLLEVGERCIRPENDKQACLDEILETATLITGTDKGNIQLLNTQSNILSIVAQIGFKPPFLKYFANVEAGVVSIYGAALDAKTRIVVEDITTDPLFAEFVSHSVFQEAGVRALQSTPLVSSTGNIIGIISTYFIRPHRSSETELRFIDILARQAAAYLERKQVEEKQTETNSRLEKILEAAKVAICVAHDPLCQHITGNKMAHDILGVSEEGNLTATPAGNLAVPYKVFQNGRELSGEDMPMQRAARTSQTITNAELEIVRENGERVTFLCTATPLISATGKITGVVGTLLDITERKFVEEKLKKEKAFSADIINKTPAIICGIAIDGTISFINPAAEALTGYRSEELIGRNWWQLFYPGNEYQQVKKLLRDFELGEVRDYEMTLTTRAGEKRIISWNSILNLNSEGKINEIVGFGNDISERKQKENELRESLRNERERLDELQTLLDTAPIGLAISKDRQGLHIVGNRTNEAMFGLPTGAELSKRGPQAYGYRVFQNGQELPVDDLPMQRALKGVLVDGQIIEIKCHSGKNLTVFAKATPLYDENEQPRGAVGAFLDITELKRTETALQAAHDTFRQLVERSPFGVYVVDADFRLALVGDGAQKVFENVWPLIGRDFADVLQSIWPEPFASDAIGHFRHTLATGETYHAPSTVEQRRDIQETESYDWKIERITLPDGRYGVVCHFYDLSERLRYESELRASEERFRAVFENAVIGIAITDLDGRFQQCNPSYCQLLGYSQEELYQVTFSELIYPEDRTANLTDNRRLKNQELPHFEIENRYIRKDGQPVWVRKFVSILQDSDGQPAHMLALVTNMTERRGLEDALREADRRKNEFLATLAHELRNPLSPISNGLHILQMPGIDHKKVERIYEMMVRQVNHMVRLVDDLMEVSRITRGKIALQKEKINLATVLKSAFEVSRPLIDSAHHQLEINIPDEPLFLEADPVRLNQVIINLLNNAAKYTPEKGKIWLCVRREGTNALISVRDNGMGIPAEMLPIVFDLFTQADRTTHRAQGGLGIGLTLVKNLVDLHGGRIEVSSGGLNQGSEFVVKLPLSEEMPDSKYENQVGNQLDNINFHRILVVDDNLDAADSTALLLQQMAAEVITVNDGHSALETLKSFWPSVVILDIGMPGMDGYEVARRIRQLPKGHEIKMIALSGWGQKEDRLKSEEAGINHHLVKPADLETLKKLLFIRPFEA
jgi:PAS domain S-box-containing protein